MAPSTQICAAIVANGEFEDSLAPEIRAADLVIAADAGLVYLDRLQIQPDLIVGDFDSVPKYLLDRYPDNIVLRYPKDKDLSDTELALQLAFEKGAQKATLFGAMGLRIDHQCYNLMLLGRYPQQVKIKTGQQEIFAFRHLVKEDCTPGQTVSLLPLFGAVTGVTSKGLRWELENKNLDMSFLSLSNETLSSRFEVEVKNGILLCCFCNPIK